MVDAMEGFGKLTIEAGNGYIDDAYARVHDDVTPGQYVVLSVTDTGSGMSPDSGSCCSPEPSRCIPHRPLYAPLWAA